MTIRPAVALLSSWEVRMSTISGRRRRFRCHVLHMHYWRSASNPDGERYLACEVCGAIHPGPGVALVPALVGRAGGI
jgi:hypothetical protein